MITIAGAPADMQTLAAQIPQGSLARDILRLMTQSGETFSYSTPDELKFELALREATVKAAADLNRSGMDFAVFRKTRCNPEYWRRTPDGGLVLLEGVSPSQAIRDIYKNGRKYATECATVILIVFYGALLSLWPDELFDKVFQSIELMNWHRVDPLFRGIGHMSPADVLIPGDRSYFSNPDVNPVTPEWQGENVIVLGDGKFYGHGIGIRDASGIVRDLNMNRSPGSDTSAYLMRRAGRPEYAQLYALGQGAGRGARSAG